MSDSPAERKRKNAAQFVKAKTQVNAIARQFVLSIASELLDATPGPFNQLPGTKYKATGRLTNGWSWGVVANTTATRWGYDGDGPWDPHGDQAYAQIEADFTVTGISYLQNDVAYGYLVHEGTENMGPRPWVDSIGYDSLLLQSIADRARLEVMSR